jgi:hypothetical protein
MRSYVFEVLAVLDVDISVSLDAVKINGKFLFSASRRFIV